MTVKKSPADAIKAENLEPRNDSTATRDAINSLVGALFEDESLYDYADIDENLKRSSGCNCALVTLLPFPDMDRAYRRDEFYQMSQALGAAHSSKMAELRRRLDECGIGYATPPAAPADDGSYRAEFSYKWAVYMPDWASLAETTCLYITSMGSESGYPVCCCARIFRRIAGTSSANVATVICA